MEWFNAYSFIIASSGTSALYVPFEFPFLWIINFTCLCEVSGDIYR